MRRRRPVEIWGAPFGVGVVSIVGLVAALLGDGLADALSWAALSVPVAISFHCSLRPGRARRASWTPSRP